MEAVIKQALQTIEVEKQVRIIYACEAGSRAWGFASDESDYDVRFLYVYPVKEYLRLDTPQDVIERSLNDKLDISGWDIYKALRLLRKSNPPLMEWLFSSVVYREETAIVRELRALVKRVYTSAPLYYHYCNMAGSHYRQHIQGKSEVPVKKYLHVLRPLIALLYLEQHQQMPPTSLLEALNSVRLDDAVRTGIHELVERKKAGGEMGLGAPYPHLNAFVDEHLQKWKKPLSERQDMAVVSRDVEQVLQRVLQAV
jgi:predicted nucleotidyltransferase